MELFVDIFVLDDMTDIFSHEDLHRNRGCIAQSSVGENFGKFQDLPLLYPVIPQNLTPQLPLFVIIRIL